MTRLALILSLSILLCSCVGQPPDRPPNEVNQGNFIGAPGNTAP